MIALPLNSKLHSLILISVAAALMIGLSGCSTKQPGYVRSLPPLPAELAAPPEPLRAIRPTLYPSPSSPTPTSSFP
ncbi:hypothetical protein SAMN03159494_03573 [Achromobacter sp. NFACC18-2]|nr:hypothetical protein SAMN03159494_03573 [Achromobacter sp. NFACC18-2]